MRPESRARAWAEPIVVAAVLFAVYAAGAAPTVYVGDSGELVAAAATLGIPHPSGYPLYVLAGKLWTMLVPIGSIAYRMSLFSAAAAAAACACLYATARSLGLGRPAALLACGLLAFAPSFWGEANVQRVYALNALFVVLAIACAQAWHRTRSDRTLAVAFFVCGLGASNHTFMAIAGVAFAAFVVLTEPRMLVRPSMLARRAALGGAAFAAGLLPYLYLPIRSRMQPRLDWGNPETLARMRDVVLRRDFWERAFIESPADLIPIAADYVSGLAHETTWVGVGLVLLGAWAAYCRRLGVAFLLLVMAGNLAALALHGSRSDIFIWHRYYIPSYAAAALLAAIGWQEVVDRLGRGATRTWARGAAWAALLLSAFLFVRGWRDADRSEYRIAEDFAYAVLESLPPGAHLIATDDNVLFVLIYLHFVEGRRPDVDLILQGVGKAELPPLRFDPDRDPLFFTHHPNWELPELTIAPLGVVYRAWRSSRPLPEPTLPRTELAGESDPDVPKDYLTQNLIGHFHYTVGFTFEDRDWRRARASFERAARAAPENDVLFYNLGLVYARNGLYDDALAAFRRSHEINPRHLASLSKPRADAKMQQVEAEVARIAAIEARLRASHPDLPPPQSPEHAVRMAQLLAEAGEPTAARGLRLRALERGAS